MKKTVLAAAIVAISAPIAFAQYRGPSDLRDGTGGRYAPITVQQVLANPRDDMDVRLEGRLVRHLHDDDYTFSDGTGEIRVELDDDDLPVTEITDKTVVIIHGEVDTHRRRGADIDIEQLGLAQ